MTGVEVARSEWVARSRRSRSNNSCRQWWCGKPDRIHASILSLYRAVNYEVRRGVRVANITPQRVQTWQMEIRRAHLLCHLRGRLSSA